MRIAILGAGAWGSALAISLGARHDVVLWTRSAENCERLARERVSAYLPQCPLPAAIRIECDITTAMGGCELAIIATATAGLRPVAESIARSGAAVQLLWACKGFEETTRRLPHEIVAECLAAFGEAGALSGPSFALEVARGQPTALVLASENAAYAQATAAALNSPRLRLYSSADLRGVELGGAVKNVIAIAAGICDGLELGRNARAALVTRGLAEMVRLGTAMGGHAETFMGLAGLGDLVLTCTGELSRNREVGVGLAQGLALDDALARLGHVAEGVRSAEAVRERARAYALEMPITEAVCSVLSGAVAPTVAVQRLLMRDPRPE
ncbi:MAG: NAD(P)H-dependent glycerol-3-phosphate dehydrogenase [Usitatibacter sp.]